MQIEWEDQAAWQVGCGLTWQQGRGMLQCGDGDVLIGVDIWLPRGQEGF